MRQYEKPDMEIIYLSLKADVQTDDWVIGGDAFPTSSTVTEPEWA